MKKKVEEGMEHIGNFLVDLDRKKLNETGMTGVTGLTSTETSGLGTTGMSMPLNHDSKKISARVSSRLTEEQDDVNLVSGDEKKVDDDRDSVQSVDSAKERYKKIKRANYTTSTERVIGDQITIEPDSGPLLMQKQAVETKIFMAKLAHAGGEAKHCSEFII